jgi:hypothetical protein
MMSLLFLLDLKSCTNAKDYGQYADENGDLIVNFISNNDITGGNSGSPVINGDGELIGTAFDGNWEAMSGRHLLRRPAPTYHLSRYPLHLIHHRQVCWC